MDQAAETPKTQETHQKKRPRLLFHVSGIGDPALESMRRFGLVANSPTLTPRLDIATYYSAGDFLTFWYPQRGEVDHGREESVQTPTQTLTEDMREEMLSEIAKMDIEDFFKNPQLRYVKEATTYLPGRRLGAVAKLGWSRNLEMILPEDSDRFISQYTKHGEEMTERVREELDRMEIKFLDPNLNKDILLNDIMRTYVEHNLSAMGNYARDSKRSLEIKLKTLEDGAFTDPVYERYRRMIISGIQRKLASMPATEGK